MKHKKLIIAGVVIFVLIVVMFAIRTYNLSRKAENSEITAEVAVSPTPTLATLEEDVVEEPIDEYKSSLGFNANEGDGRVPITVTPKPEETPPPVESIKPKYDIVTTVFDNTSVPDSMVDGSSCKKYLKEIALTDFETDWNATITDKDIKGGKKHLVGVAQNKNDYEKGDLQSVGWLMNRLSELKPNDIVKFTNLHVIGDVGVSHVALLCCYDWYSAYGLEDTLVLFEDISKTLDVKSFKAGDVFSTSAFVHNISVEVVNGYRVLHIHYVTY